MDDIEDGSRYPTKPFSFNRHPRYPRSIRARHVYSYGPEEEVDDDDDEEEEEEEEEEENDDVEDDDDNDPVYLRRIKEGERFERYPKRQKLRTSVPSYEYTPDQRESFKNTYDWTQQEIYVLLEVWGNRFLQLGRRSLRVEDWVDVAEKVSDALKSEKNEAQCRRMLDGLKRKFKKEKSKAERMGLNSSKWVFFRKMEMLMGLGSSFRQQESGLACGVDSGEFVFMNPQVYLDRSNGFDEMRDSPAESEMEEDDEEEADGGSRTRREGTDEHSMRMLADSVQRFGKIYEKIESSKREHIRELEKMRMDFQKELEVQKKQILERAQAEIAKMKEEDDTDEEEESDEDDEENVNSSENISQ
ncbi:hypothetical protein DITRI_Ditri10aG0066500 [Diplodiscus trichospermus]